MTNEGAGYPSFGTIGLGNAVASEGTSLMGRLRSGSMGSAPPPPLTGVPGRYVLVFDFMSFRIKLGD